jgi:hypothetical protein
MTEYTQAGLCSTWPLAEAVRRAASLHADSGKSRLRNCVTLCSINAFPRDVSARAFRAGPCAGFPSPALSDPPGINQELVESSDFRHCKLLVRFVLIPGDNPAWSCMNKSRRW